MEVYRSWAETLERTAVRLWDALSGFLPNLAGAILLLVLGWVVARIVRLILRRILRNLVDLTAGWGGRLGLTGSLAWPLDRILAEAAYWLIILFFITAAADVLEMPAVARWLSTVLAILPKLALGVAIVLLGYGLSRPIGEAVATAAERARMAQAAALGAAVRMLFLVIVALLGIEQLGLDITLLANLVTIVIAASIGALALAFGVGAGPAVRNIMAAHYVRKAYRVGQRVRVGEVEGDILEITQTAVVLDTDAGRTSVPAQLFGEQASVLLTQVADG